LKAFLQEDKLGRTFPAFTTRFFLFFGGGKAAAEKQKKSSDRPFNPGRIFVKVEEADFKVKHEPFAFVKKIIVSKVVLKITETAVILTKEASVFMFKKNRYHKSS
jgi:hypothetical protein